MQVTTTLMILSSTLEPSLLLVPNTDPDLESDMDPEPAVARAVVLGIVFFSLIVLALLGNLLVCAAILLDRKLRKPENLFLVSLAWADMLVAILVMIFAAIHDILGHWSFGYYYCKIWMSFDVMCSTASILSLCCVSFDRYLHIKSPMRYEQTMTQRKITLIIVGIWLLSASISFIPICLGWHIGADGNDIDETTCTLTLSVTYAALSSVVSFYIPCTVMIAVYYRLYSYAQRHVSAMKQQQLTANSAVNSPSGALDASTPLNGSPSVLGGKRRFRSETINEYKARITIGVIMGVFLFSWFPFFTVNIVRALCRIPDWVFTLLTWIGYANSTANPIIYSIFNQNFRKAFKKILRCNNEYGLRPSIKRPRIRIVEVNSSGKSRRLSSNSNSSSHSHSSAAYHV